MAGFFQPPGAIVNEIKNLLKGRYQKGFPIIKEIIQNANDGQASTLDFGIIQRLDASVEHPLLRDPALFFLNNGNFSQADRGAICQFGMDRKSGDKGKIGKFGLGQKSVFHFCESFFYIARSNEIPEGCGDFINPWQPPTGSDPKRPDWIELTEGDRQALESFVISEGLVNPDNPRYFLLWIPLRKPVEDSRYILSNLYDVDSIQNDLPPDMDLQIAQILPSLRYIEKVSYSTQESDHTLKQHFNISLQALENQKLERCRYPQNKQGDDAIYLAPATYDLKGKANIDKNNSCIEFGGKERILPVQPFMGLIENGEAYSQDSFWDRLEQSQHWPRRQTADENGESHDEPDKVLPHCAVLFSRKRPQAATSTFTIQWAVFLPVAGREQAEQAEFFECSCDGEYDYSLLLHGYFFLDSGRKYIEALEDVLDNDIEPQLPKTEEELNRQWNYILATQGTLRLILPALKEFAQSHQLQPDEILHLCAGLSQASCFKESNRKYLCADYQWSYRLHPTQCEWLLLDTVARIRSLPKVPPSWDVFPALKQFTEQDYLTLGDSPNLRIELPRDQWTGTEVVEVLKSLDPQIILSQAQYLRYLTEFLDHSGIVKDPSVQKQLCVLLAKGFRAVDLQLFQDEKLCQFLKGCISLLEPQKRFRLDSIPEAKAHPDEANGILKQLFQLDLSCLLVYAPFDPTKPSKGTLDKESVAKCLVTIADIFRQSADAASQIIADCLVDQFLVLEVAPEVLHDHPELRIFRGYNYLTKQFEVYSLSNLEDFHQEHRLFRTGMDLDRDSFATALQQAIAGQEVIVIPSLKADRLEENIDDISGCNQKGCQRMLRTCPRLADAPQRADLLKKLAPGIGMEQEMRYLLHASAKNYDDDEAIYYIPTDSADNAFWEKLGKQVLDKREESWRILNLDLVQLLLPSTYGHLSIEPLKANSVIKEIEQSYEEQGKACLDTTEWVDKDYDQLLIYLFNNSKPTLWEGLALHKDSEGQRTSIDERTFLISDETPQFRCPTGLSELVPLIPTSSNPQVRVGQEAQIPKWSAHQALLILLSQHEPHLHFHSIMEVLEQSLETLWKRLLPDEATSLKRQFKNTQWLLTTAGSGVSPDDIVLVPQSLKRHESAILSIMEGTSISNVDKSIHNYKASYQWLKKLFKSPDELEILPKILAVVP